MRRVFAVLFCTIGLCCFAGEAEPLKDWQNETLKHLTNANISLLSDKAWRALADLQKAEASLDKSDQEAMAFQSLILFGRVIAYDVLGFKEQCQQTIGSLFLVVNAYHDDSDDQEIPLSDEEVEQTVEFLRKLVDVAPSLEVRELLLSVLDVMSEALPTDSTKKA